MKTVSLAGRSASFTEILNSVDAFVASTSITIALMSAAVCYFGCLFESDLTMAISGVTSFFALYRADRKGGEK